MVGWSQLVARGRHDMVLVELELQHYLELKHIDEHMRTHRIWDTYDGIVYPHCLNVNINNVFITIYCDFVMSFVTFITFAYAFFYK